MLFFFLYAFCQPSNKKGENKDESIFNLSIGALRSSINPIPIDYSSIFGQDSVSFIHPQTLSEYLIGEKIYSSLFQINTAASEQCKIMKSLSLTKQQQEKLINIIDNKYQLVFMHPLYKVYSSKSVNGNHISGVDVGIVKNGKHYISNSFKFTIHKTQERVASIKVEVFHSSDNLNCLEESSANEISIEDNQNINIYYSYQFSSEQDPKEITSFNREDSALIDKNQTYAIKNFQNMPIIISVIVTLLLIFNIYKSIYKESKHADNDLDEYDGCEWKLIHADVCRSPVNPEKLSELFGWGIQLLVSLLVTIFFLNFKPKSEGASLNISEILNIFIKSFIFASPIGGFFTGKMFKTIGSREWKTVILASSLFLALFLLIPRFLISTISPPISTLNFSLLKILTPLGLNFVLHSIGCLIGLKFSGFELSQKINILPRQVPPHSVLFNTYPLGVLSSLFVSLILLSNYHSLLETLWGDRIPNDYTSVCYCLTSIFSMIILSIDFGIIMVFLQLKKEDYKWWWTAYWSGGMNGLIFFFFSILDYFELFTTKHLKHFIFYTLINMPIFIIISIISGAMSFIGCFFFVQLIYNSLKME